MCISKILISGVWAADVDKPFADSSVLIQQLGSGVPMQIAAT